MALRYFIAVVGLALLYSFLGSVGTKASFSPPGNDEKELTPKITPITARLWSKPSSPEEKRLNPIRDLSERAMQLDERDQAGLEALFVLAEKAIREREEQIFSDLERNLEWWAQQDFESSFFNLMSLIRYSRDPVRTAQILVEHPLPPKSAGSGHHGEQFTLVDRQYRLQSFALRYLRKQMHAGRLWLSTAESDALLGIALQVGARSQSMDVAIEGAHLVRLLSQNPEQDAQALLSLRSSEERKILRVILTSPSGL